MRLFLVVGLALAAAGCSDVRNAIHPGETRMLTRDFLPPEVEQNPPELFCYRTLGAQECHSVPLQGQQHRLVGHYNASPEAVGR